MSEKIEKSLKHLFTSIKGDENIFYKNNVGELLKTAGKNKPKKALYSAAFLTEGSREDLYNWWKMHVKEEPLDRVPKHSHMTIKFKPSHEDILALPIGESGEEKKTVTVIGYCENKLGQVVMVRVSDESFARQDDGIAHITISASSDAPRGFAYSNQLLCEGVQEVKSGPELKVRIGMFMQNGEIKYDLEGTFYHTSMEESIEVTI